MVTDRISRRAFGALLAAVCARPTWADDVVDLEWEDLLPADAALHEALRGVIAHDNATLAEQQPQSLGVRHDWNGQTVRLPGFIIPIEHKGTGVTAFILAPYVGACVHVPPPPANQLVFVTTQEPYETAGLFEPVNVIGMFGAAPRSTQLAQIGYAISADEITPYR